MDYPRNLREFDRLFAHKDACLRFLELVRWGDAFRCQRCGGREFWALATGLRRCRSCRFKNSVKTGTIFESSRLPLKMWFYAIWWITAQKSGVSALDLQKDIGLGSYRSAWLLLHKIRSAMLHADRSLLDGDVEMGEAALGTGRILVAAEFSGLKHLGRIRIARVPEGKAADPEAFLLANVAKSAMVHANGKISSSGRTKREPARARPRVHLVTEQLHRWLKDTLHGRVEAKHLDSYLEEFVFRFNRRTSKARGVLFQRMLENAVRVPPAPYKKIVSRKP